MFKKFIRWILPFMILMLVAMYLAFSPVLASHAATPATNNQAPVHTIQQPHDDSKQKNVTPDMYWRP